MDYTQYVNPELLILIPVLYLIGIGIKKSNIADKYIPFLLGLISIILSALWIFANDTIDGSQSIMIAVFSAITQGILCAGASVYANQIVKQIEKEE